MRIAVIGAGIVIVEEAGGVVNDFFAGDGLRVELLFECMKVAVTADHVVDR